MPKQSNTLRGRVIAVWKGRGKGKWSKEETLGVCKAVDYQLEVEGLDPAPMFRKALADGNKTYITQWLLGCHFSWLNPR